jgi:hypothetical protein
MVRVVVAPSSEQRRHARSLQPITRERPRSPSRSTVERPTKHDVRHVMTAPSARRALPIPSHLEPWAAQLGLLPVELALFLGGLLLRLEQLVGPGEAGTYARGEPDGYRGIARRGPLQRLLPSEWLLLQELPEEFLRRLASGEQAFWQQDLRAEGAGRRCVVLFDSGPAQLGAPRLVHLALLMLLERRAHASKADFEWGVLQDQRRRLSKGVDREAITSLLASRSLHGVSEDDVRQWSAAITALGKSALWVIGAESSTSRFQAIGAAEVVADDVIDPGAPPRVLVQHRSGPDRGVRQLLLDVPEPGIAARLLRAPFDRPPVAPKHRTERIATGSDLAFAANNRRLYACADSRTLLSFHFAQPPHAESRPPQSCSMPYGEHIVAVLGGWSNRAGAVLTQAERRLTVGVLSRRSSSVVSQSHYEAAEGYEPPSPALGRLQPMIELATGWFCYVDRAGTLVSLRDHRATAVEHVGHCAIAALPTLLMWPVVDDGNARLMCARARAGGALEVTASEAYPELPPGRAPTRLALGPSGAVFGYQIDDLEWLVVRDRKSAAVRVLAGERVIGAIATGRDSSTAGLLVLGVDRRALSLRHPTASEPLLNVTTEVTNACLDRSGSLLAFATVVGEVGVYSLVARRSLPCTTTGGRS